MRILINCLLMMEDKRNSCVINCNANLIIIDQIQTYKLLKYIEKLFTFIQKTTFTAIANKLYTYKANFNKLYTFQPSLIIDFPLGQVSVIGKNLHITISYN